MTKSEKLKAMRELKSYLCRGGYWEAGSFNRKVYKLSEQEHQFIIYLINNEIDRVERPTFKEWLLG